MITKFNKQMTRQILFIHSDQIVAMGIENQLRNAEGFDLISVSAEDERAIIDDILRYQPEIIVANGNTQFMTNPWLEEHFKTSPQLQIVIVESETNRMVVFQKKEFPITKGEDLIAAIR